MTRHPYALTVISGAEDMTDNEIVNMVRQHAFLHGYPDNEDGWQMSANQLGFGWGSIKKAFRKVGRAIKKGVRAGISVLPGGGAALAAADGLSSLTKKKKKKKKASPSPQGMATAPAGVIAASDTSYSGIPASLASGAKSSNMLPLLAAGAIGIYLLTKKG